MRLRWVYLLIALAMAVVGIGLTASATVDYSHSVTDLGNDVMDVSNETYVDIPGLDILSMSSARMGDNVTFTMTFADELNRSASLYYEFDVDPEGTSDHFTLYWSTWGFSATSRRSTIVPVDGKIADDNLSVTWIVLLENVGAEEELVLFKALARIEDGGSYKFADWLVPGEVEEPEPVHYWVSYEINFTFILRTRQYKIEGDDVIALRERMDSDGDGTVSSAEVDEYLDEVSTTDEAGMMPMTGWDTGHIGNELTVTYSLATGPVDNEAPVFRTEVLKSSYASSQMSENIFHWNAENTYLGLDVWNASDESEFSIYFDDGPYCDRWEFNRSAMTSAERAYLSSDNKVFLMNGADMRADWNDTMRVSEGFSIKNWYVDETTTPDPTPPPSNPSFLSDSPCIVISFIVILTILVLMMINPGGYLPSLGEVLKIIMRWRS